MQPIAALLLLATASAQLTLTDFDASVIDLFGGNPAATCDVVAASPDGQGNPSFCVYPSISYSCPVSCSSYAAYAPVTYCTNNDDMTNAVYASTVVGLGCSVAAYPAAGDATGVTEESGDASQLSCLGATVQVLCPQACGTVPAGCPAPVAATKDPHFKLPHGGRADIRGVDGVVYNLLSAKNTSFNARFEKADFKWARRTVHGTKISEAFWTLRTLTNQLVTVEFKAVTAKGGHAAVTVDGVAQKNVTESTGAFKVSNVLVSLVGRKVIVKSDRWTMTAGANPFPFAALNKGKLLLDVQVDPLYDADHDVVAPHGIFGQAWDGDDVAVDGRVDKAAPVEMATEAQGEGAIEGVISDYAVTSKFATDFKYSRFDATSAPHRDISKLTGMKRNIGKAARQGGATADGETPTEPKPVALPKNSVPVRPDRVFVLPKNAVARK